METKVCSKCGMELPLSEFGKDKRRIDGLKYKCKHCEKEYREQNKEILLEYYREYQAKHRDRLNELARARYNKLKEIKPIIPKGVSTKVCSCCCKELPLAYFHKAIGRKYGIDNICKECKRAYNKKYRLEHINEIKAKKKAYMQTEIAKYIARNSDGYIRGKLHRSGFPKECITPDLIAFKRAHIQLKREIKRQESQEPNNN